MSRVTDTRLLWALCAGAAISFAATLPLPYIGEEGIYTIVAMEMKASGDYFVTTLYGTNQGQPPLFSWLIIALSQGLGWENVLVAARMVAAVATIASALVLAWLVTAVTKDKRLAALAALVYLTSDALLYHGWLAYTDPLFAFFTFAAIACLWVAAVRRSIALVWIAAAALSCAALSKGQTCYLFYVVAAAVLLSRRDLRAFLVTPGVLVPHLAMAALFLVWHNVLTGGVQQATAVNHALAKLRVFDFGEHLHQLWWFPLEIMLRFAPASFAVAYFWLRREPAAAKRCAVRHRVRDRGVDRIPELPSVLAVAAYGDPLRHAALSAGRVPDRTRAVAAESLAPALGGALPDRSDRHQVRCRALALPCLSARIPR